MRVVPWKDVKTYKPPQIPTWPVWVPKKRIKKGIKKEALRKRIAEVIAKGGTEK